MKRLMAGLALLVFSTGAWTSEPCCNVVAINARTGVLGVKNMKTGKVTQYKAEPAGIKGLRVGDKVDLVGGRLRTAAGASIAGQVRP